MIHTNEVGRRSKGEEEKNNKLMGTETPDFHAKQKVLHNDFHDSFSVFFLFFG